MRELLSFAACIRDSELYFLFLSVYDRLTLYLRCDFLEVLVVELHCGHLQIVLVLAYDLRLL